jgi:hypothetical protein
MEKKMTLFALTFEEAQNYVPATTGLAKAATSTPTTCKDGLSRSTFQPYARTAFASNVVRVRPKKRR